MKKNKPKEKLAVTLKNNNVEPLNQKPQKLKVKKLQPLLKKSRKLQRLKEKTNNGLN